MSTATATKSIRCGNCKGTHHSSNEVRECYQGAPAVSTLPAQAHAAAHAQPSTGPAATDKQMAFLATLVAERVHGWDDPALVLSGLRTSKAAASAAITTLLAADKAEMKSPQPQGSYPKVPAGYYAVESTTGNNDLDFFCVQLGKPGGKWEGRSFVKRVVGGHPEFSVQGVHARLVLERIQDAPGGFEGAAARYGQEIGSCGKCNRTLTDETSRALGIGPVCRAQGW